jgi:hypothetical protein
MLPPGGFRSTPFRPRLPFFAGLPPGARSPWAPPAATGEACLDPTSLADFCQPSRMPGHTWRAPVPHAKRRFRRLAVPDPERPGTVSGPVVPAPRRTPAGPAEVARVSVRAAAAEANSNSPGRPRVVELPRRRGPNPPATPPNRGLPSGQPRERGEPSRRPEAPSATRELGRSANRTQPSRKHLRESASTRPRLFHESRCPTSTGGTTGGPRRDTSEDRLATSPFRGAPRRP